MDIYESATTQPPRLLSVVGTRTEAIKIAPIAIEARRRPGLQFDIVSTGQQDALFDDALAGFGLAADHRLPPIPHDRCPDAMTARLAAAIGPVFAREQPDRRCPPATTLRR